MFSASFRVISNCWTGTVNISDIYMPNGYSIPGSRVTHYAGNLNFWRGAKKTAHPVRTKVRH